MSAARTRGPQNHDATLAACLLAVDPVGLGGVSVRSAFGPAIDSFLKLLRQVLPRDVRFRRMPLQIADGRLLGGLDLAATLQAGRPVLEQGLLADCDGGCVVLPMAERLPLPTAARLCAVLDSGEVVTERDGFAHRNRCRLTVVALDEGATDDEQPPSALLDRLALHLNLEAMRYDDEFAVLFSAVQIETARRILGEVIVDEAVVRAFCHSAAAIGIASVRAPIYAVKIACIHAALAGRRHLLEADAIVASRLVLAPRATFLPMPAPDSASPGESAEQDQQDNAPRSPDAVEGDDASQAANDSELQDVILEATRAAIPAHLLAQLQQPAATRTNASSSGRCGAQRHVAQRGRPIGIRRGDLNANARLNLIETLRAAAPWQTLRRRQSGSSRVHVHRDDFRVTRFKQRSESATIFVVDASGSSALHRLAETKGAVELLLADCYVRRDQVALIAFRGKRAELILPPTRSLVRAKRSLCALPGGGGTPIAAALDAAGALADGLRRKGLSPTIVVLTDGRANVARDGGGGRERAEIDALAAARSCRRLRLAALLVDTSPTPGPAAGRLAAEMGARYLALPRADAATISKIIRDTAPSK